MERICEHQRFICTDSETIVLRVQGPAVWALRAQTDKIEYSTVMRRVLEATPNLFLREGMVVDLDLGPNDEVCAFQHNICRLSQRW